MPIPDDVTDEELDGYLMELQTSELEDLAGEGLPPNQLNAVLWALQSPRHMADDSSAELNERLEELEELINSIGKGRVDQLVAEIKATVNLNDVDEGEWSDQESSGDEFSPRDRNPTDRVNRILAEISAMTYAEDKDEFEDEDD